MAAEQLPFDFSAPNSLAQLWSPDDIYRACTGATIEAFKEDNRVERKRIEIQQRDFAENVSMWANTPPNGGIIFLGVDKSGKILGCKHIEQEHLNRLRAVRRICSDADIQFKNIPVINHLGEDDCVIAVRVHYHQDKLVETSDGNAFIREGDEKRHLTETEKQELRLSKGELHVSRTTSTGELLNLYREAYIAKRHLQVELEKSMLTFRSAQAVPVGHEHHERISTAASVAPRRLDHPLNLFRPQMLSLAQVFVFWAGRRLGFCHCPIFSGWRHQMELRLCHDKSAPRDRYFPITKQKWDSASISIRHACLSQSVAGTANRGPLRGTIASPTDTDGVQCPIFDRYGVALAVHDGAG